MDGPFKGQSKDPLGFVVSLNLTRRHLDTSQRALVAAKLANMDRGNPNFNNANTENSVIAVSQNEAAKLLNVSTDSVQFAKKDLELGSEKLIE